MENDLPLAMIPVAPYDQLLYVGVEKNGQLWLAKSHIENKTKFKAFYTIESFLENWTPQVKH